VVKIRHYAKPQNVMPHATERQDSINKKQNMNKFLLSILTMIPFIGFGQSYTSYLTGSVTDIVTIPSGGVCLMGGATEDDNAMKWFLHRANGGDILVLRATGSNGYNSYLYSGLGITVNSVETIVCNNASASSDPYVLQKIQQAVKQAQEMTERAESDIEGYVYSSWNDEFEVDFDTE
jgi:hypothetical protein